MLLPRRPVLHLSGSDVLSGRALTARFFDRPVLAVARDLLGRDVTHAGVTVRLTEVEAYRGADDMGSHAFRGRTKRNEVMFGPAGGVYVYFTYGMHWCANLVCQRPGEAAAVLLRAGRVVDGLGVAAERRPGSPERDLARGPGRLGKALAIDGSLNGTAVGTPVRVSSGVPVPDDAVETGPRVGVTRDAERPWRFWVAGEPTVSVYRPAVRRAGPPRPSPTV